MERFLPLPQFSEILRKEESQLSAYVVQVVVVHFSETCKTHKRQWGPYCH